MTDEGDAHRIISTAKLVVTFSAAIAATFVATAMQIDHEHDPWVLDDLAALLMFAALGFTIAVVMLPSHREDATKLKGKAHSMMVVQVWLASASSLLATIALLAADWNWLP